MANKKISELSAAGALAGTELVEVVKGGVNVQTTTQDIADLGGAGGGTWGSITGTLSSQTDLQNALNDKSDAGATVSAKVGAYTLLAADLTLVNAGATLIIDGDSSADLTVPLNSSVAFPVGSFIGVRDFNNVVATGGVTITGTSGSLAIPSGMTATLEKTATDTWILHNGGASTSVPDADETTKGIVELATTAEATTGTDTVRAVTPAGLKARMDARAETYSVAFTDEVSPITATTNKITFHWPYANTTITGIWVGLSTVQTSGSIFTVDVHKAGTTILSTKITVDNGEETSRTAATPPVLSVTSITIGDKVTVDVDQVGDNTAKGGKLYIEYTRP